MRMIICDVCEDKINLSEGGGFLNTQMKELIADFTQEVFDVCVCCTNSLQTEIKNLIEDWRSTKGSFQK